MRYRSTYRSRRHRRSNTNTAGATSYLMPFLILICVGVIIILLFNLWKTLFGEDKKVAAYMHIVEGSVQMKSWGVDDFVDLNSDVVIRTGDEIIANPDSRVIVEFFDGTIMRLADGSDVVFEEINDDDSDPELRLLLMDGKVWFNKVYKNTKDTNLIVNSPNLSVIAGGVSSFAMENDFDETMRVINGDDVLVDILNEDGKSVDRETVGVGQEFVLTEQVLDKYLKYQSPSVLTAISDLFERSEWYLWNIEEDKNPTIFKKPGEFGENFVEVDPVDMLDDVEDPSESVTAEDDISDSVTADENTDSVTAPEEEEQPVEPDPEPEVALAKPQITSVSGVTQTDSNGYYVISSKTATIRGTVSGASSVQVSGYTLKQFSAGDTSWTYYANADYNLMTPGANSYSVVAVDANGKKSESLVVKVWYNPPEPDPEPTPAPVVDTSTVPVVTDPAPADPVPADPVPEAVVPEPAVVDPVTTTTTS